MSAKGYHNWVPEEMESISRVGMRIKSVTCDKCHKTVELEEFAVPPNQSGCPK